MKSPQESCLTLIASNKLRSNALSHPQNRGFTSVHHKNLELNTSLPHSFRLVDYLRFSKPRKTVFRTQFYVIISIVYARLGV